MRIGTDIRVGAATHTGSVRGTNEDDYLLVESADRELAEHVGRIFVLADGMGGVTGGGEASRAAVRSLAAGFLGGDTMDLSPVDRMVLGFDRACHRVFQLSRESPVLRGMGTTMTALNLVGDKALLGHVGDSRCLRLRDGKLTCLTEDHVSGEGDGDLMRCVGGGTDTEEVDLIECAVNSGDVYLLASDGLWGTVSEEVQSDLLARRDPQSAADELIRQALLNGGPDNCTAVVLRIVEVGGRGEDMVEVTLSTEEPGMAPPAAGKGQNLRRRRWPWLVMLGSVVVGSLAILKAVFGVGVL